MHGSRVLEIMQNGSRYRDMEANFERCKRTANYEKCKKATEENSQTHKSWAQVYNEHSQLQLFLLLSRAALCLVVVIYLAFVI